MYKVKEQFIGKVVMDKDGVHELTKDMNQKDLKKLFEKGHFVMIEKIEDTEKSNKEAIESNKK